VFTKQLIAIGIEEILLGKRYLATQLFDVEDVYDWERSRNHCLTEVIQSQAQIHGLAADTGHAHKFIKKINTKEIYKTSKAIE
jgi:hypothetical protein